MSVTIEDKIGLFNKMIFGKIETHSSERRQDLIGKYNEELLKLEKEIEEKRVELLKAADLKAERERMKLLAQLKSQEQRKLVASKQKFIDKAMALLYNYAEKLTTTEDYKEVLSKALDNVSKDFNGAKLIHFYVLKKENDIFLQVLQDNIEKFGHDFKYVIEVAPINILGGFIAEDREKLLQIDLSLRTMVEEYRDTVGAAITRKFEEVSSHE